MFSMDMPGKVPLYKVENLRRTCRLFRQVGAQTTDRTVCIQCFTRTGGSSVSYHVPVSVHVIIPAICSQCSTPITRDVCSLSPAAVSPQDGARGSMDTKDHAAHLKVEDGEGCTISSHHQ